MIHVRREIPEHPVIDAMERWGYYPVFGRGRRCASGKPVTAGASPRPTVEDGRYEGKKAVYILQVVL